MHQTSDLPSQQRWRSGAMVIGLLAFGATLVAIGVGLWRLGTAGASPLPIAKRNVPKLAGTARPLAPTPVRIAQCVYLLGDMWPSVVYVVETSDGLAIIDAGLESAHDTLLAGMSTLGLDIGRLKMILLTHSHGDHALGAQRLRDETGAKIYIGREDAGPLRRGAPWEAIFSKFDMEREALHPTTVDGELADRQVLELGQARFTVVATPGHTPGSCCFLLEVEGQRALFAGDTIMTLSADTGTYATKLAPRYRGEVNRYLRSFEKLRRLPAPDLVLPGHPGYEPAPADPRLSAAQWNALLQRGVDELRLIRQRYARDGADFLDGGAKQILDELYYLGDFEGQAAYAVLSGGQALVFNGVRGQDAARRLAAAWQALGLAAPAISAVVLTSCEAENLTGLKSVVEGAGCRVVAPPEGLEAVARFCEGANVVSSEELSALGWEEVHSLPVAGAGGPQAAYHFCRGETVALVSGSVPIDADFDEFVKRSQQGPPTGWDARLLAESLSRLKSVMPDVWLSAVPWRGRNANLYDRDWTDTLTMNYHLLRHWQAAPGKRYGQ